MKKRFISCMLGAAAMTSILTGTFVAAVFASGERTITDHAGNEVVIPDNIENIAVTDTYPLVSVLSLYLGSASEIKEISPVSMGAAKAGLLGELYPDILKADTSFYTDNQLNIEELIKDEPDIAFYNASSTQIGEELKAAGIPAIAVSVTDWDYNAADTCNAWFELLEEIFPEKNDIAEAVADYNEKMYKLVQERVKDLDDDEKKTVFYLFNYSDTAMITSGRNFWGQYWCDAAGAVNAGEEIEVQKSNASVNMEQVYDWDPDVIIISNFTSALPEDLYENKIGKEDWSTVKAVENKEVYKMPLGAYRTFTPGADTPMTILWTAKTVYPDLFEDIDLIKEVKKYYKKVFDIELTDEQAEKMYIPTAEAAEGYKK